MPQVPVSLRRSLRVLPPAVLGGFVTAGIAVALISFFTLRSLQSREVIAGQVTQALDVLQRLQNFLSSVKDAETGQRGFLLTGEESYLNPHAAAVDAVPVDLARLRQLLSTRTTQLERLDLVERAAREKFQELEQTIALRRRGDVTGALAIVRTDRGQALMDRVRELVGQIEADERSVLANRQREWQAAVTLSSRITWGGSLILLVLTGAAALLMSRDHRARETEVWLRAGQAGLSARMQGEQRLETLGHNVLVYLAGYLEAQVGALYLAESSGQFRRVAGYALPPGFGHDVLRSGDGLLGQAARDNRTLHVQDVPDGYLPVVSSLGQADARELLVVPASVDGVVNAVVELGFLHPVEPGDRALLARVSESLGVAVRAAHDRTRLEELLEETQEQASVLQAQQEELQVSNEELEQHSRALLDSHTELQAQQAELEQVNAQLEEHMQQVEIQRDELATAQSVLQERADDLVRANTYKSEFLANMSHELRTPLNSSLILAKLLTENKEGNLTAEQIKFARTISAAGNDLLALINDILDLSKIEAGKVDVTPEPLSIRAAVDTVVQGVQPIAAQKGLALTVTLAPGVPTHLDTDAHRLAQILRNLLSNALKFTERGSVSLEVSADPADTVSFAVRDTGIGIPDHQQHIIFDAFQQADGSTQRKYGGTGLGLSISRDLSRLLGGDIHVRSTPGHGSVFTLTLPRVYADAQRAIRDTPFALTSALPVARAAPRLASVDIDDDRSQLGPDARVILVVEDDARFAAILRDLAHEMGFQCVVASSARDGVATAALIAPSAILLDIHLPDSSGLGVLDQLKRNPGTRHIPVHVISVADYTQQALERGAIGYALKPVKREELIDAFHKLEAKATQRLRRVLVAEDDDRQRDSIRRLLENDDVEITDVASAGAALQQLQETTFDCMVIDLNLPDVSGYELLETMAGRDDVSFPPVIVYTGRSLTHDHEQTIRRFSRSIIIKDARSPERLLDEVTLFLHQVEATLPIERRRMLQAARDRDTALSGRRILVVEDDARNIFALASLLEPKGAAIEIARNGREAIAALTRSAATPARAIDMVLMDIMMPEMDGLEALREIRQRPEWTKLPIIALTAKAMQDDHQRCLAAGANDYIAKPLDVEQLLSLVRVWMPK